MKKQLIATLVGGVILFLWQFLSWALLNIHGAEFKYTPNQDKIIEALSQNLSENGSYMIPQSAPGSSRDQQTVDMGKAATSPWAVISYHERFDNNMGMNMLRGILVDWVAVFLLVWMLLKITNLDFKTALLAALSVGGIAYLTIPYTDTIWFDNESIGYLIDAAVQWGLVGAWLGWWLTRR